MDDLQLQIKLNNLKCSLSLLIIDWTIYFVILLNICGSVYDDMGVSVCPRSNICKYIRTATKSLYISAVYYGMPALENVFIEFG